MSQTITPQNPPETRPDPTAHSGLTALLTSAAISPIERTGWIKITGPDRVRWLNGMATNSIQDLTPGLGNYNLFLNAQGRIQGDGQVFAEPDHLLLQTASSQIPNLLPLLDRFIIMDDVELADISSNRSGLLLAGPQAPAILRTLNLTPSTGTNAALSLIHLPWQSLSLTIVQAWSPLVPRFEIWSDEPSIARLQHEILAQAATPCTPAAVDLLRICEGTPLFGVDIRDRDLPQETGAARALHFNKGCYLGQEIVERIRSRGNVHRTFSGFHLEGVAPPPGTPLLADAKPVGELTSIATVDTESGPAQLALGYIRREALVLGKPIAYDGGIAQPASLPFAIPSELGKDPWAATHI